MIAGICAGAVVLSLVTGFFLRKYFCSSGPKAAETTRINVQEHPEVEIPAVNKGEGMFFLFATPIFFIWFMC